MRLGNLTYNHGQKKPSSEFCYIDIGSIDNQHQRLNEKETIVAPENAASRARKIVKTGDILYSTVRPYLHNMCIIDREFTKEPIASTGFAVLKCCADYSNAFLFYYMMSPDFDNYANDSDNSKGVAYPAINDERLSNALIPVPPVMEQYRILNQLSKVLPIVQVYDGAYRNLENLSTTFPIQLKKSILQYAVQGKLVPQDPTDEPASALLECIRAEKEQLIKSGKVKRDKHESVIFRRDNSYYERVDGIERCIDDEIPFEIPENWEVVRLQNIGEYRKGPFGSSLTKSMFVPKSKSSIKVYEQKNAIQKDCTLGTYYIPMEYYNEKMKGFTVLPNDIIVSCAGTIGETYILPSSAEIGIINQALMRMRITSQINVDYFLIYFDYVVKETARESSKGSAIKNIPPFDIFKKIILPLPPLKEQKRIIQEVQTIQSLISSL